MWHHEETPVFAFPPHSLEEIGEKKMRVLKWHFDNIPPRSEGSWNNKKDIVSLISNTERSNADYSWS